MPVGSIDTGTAPILEKEVDAILEKDPRVVIFDMGGVEYISSMGVRVFIKTKKDLKRIGGRLMMVNLLPRSKRSSISSTLSPKRRSSRASRSWMSTSRPCSARSWKIRINHCEF